MITTLLRLRKILEIQWKERNFFSKTGSDIGMKLKKGKFSFIKHHVSRDINPARGDF
jgi:hypothetical protein